MTVAAAAAVLAVGIAACSSAGAPPGSGSSSGAKQAGGTATVALPADTIPNYIFPFVSITNASVYNTNQFQYLEYRPLYMFGNNGDSLTVNYHLSTANAPVYSDGGRTVTITMKGWKWNNGETVDAQDVVFFLNMLEAEKSSYYGYAPGLLPDNLASYSATGPDTLVLRLNKAYSSIWFTYNQLATISPFPESWDIKKSGATPGSGGCATDTAKDHWAKCVAVYDFLTAQAKDAATYATNPVWAVSDGPWKLSAYTTNGNATFVPNPDYSGSPKPSLSAVKFVPYTSDTTEYTALRTGQLNVGYIPSQDLPQKSLNQVLPSTNPLGSNYALQPFYQDAIAYFVPNLNNPTIGAAFRQLYIREALQETVDQNGIDEAIWRGYAYPSSGAVPNQPPSQWIPPAQRANNGQGPYAFNIKGAKALLTSHGWSEVGGVMTCEDSSKCGDGIATGTKLSLTINYSTGNAAYAQEMSVYKSDASQAGIQVNLDGQSFNTVVGESSPCQPGPKCTWDALFYGGWAYDGPGYEPTGEPLFQTGAGSNSGSYTNSQMDSLINQTHTSSDLSVFKQYASYAAQQIPFIWLPENYPVQAVSGNLQGVTFNPLYAMLPEYWYFTK
ncbi:MAG TPA: ABC transporter substrate-binding protein [Trebonia sp.]|nr:ABC transporter substrate-binding protein [Trebonia sp.]